MTLLSRRVLWIPVLASCFWLAITFSLFHHASDLALQHQQDLEHMHLSTIAQQLLSIRNWNAEHGGIYVRESDIGRPNPWLPEDMRQTTTTDGKRLVMLNPAYMSRQLADRISTPGMNIAIVGQQPMRPGNKADTWESMALEECTSGPLELFTPPSLERSTANDKKRMRLLAVLKAEQSCLYCHTGRKVGDVLGGISISQDATNYVELANSQRQSLCLTYAFMGLTGLLVIGGLTGLLALRRWQAEETNRMQRTLMARLSHDMRTPLTGILGMVDLLGNSKCTPDEREQALHYLAQAGTTLLEMVSDITDHAQLQQQDTTLHLAPFDVAQTCSECVDLYRPVARAKGLELQLVLGHKLPPFLVGDAFRIRQVLGNLVSNAVKFTASGYVRVVVTARPLADNYCRLRVMVLDSGPGVPKGEQQAIFEMYHRGSQGRHQPGTGLGLGIARGIARKMGGDVVAYSRRRHGAGFGLALNLHMADGPGTTSGDTLFPGEDAPCLQGLNILVAEDNAPCRYALQVALQRAGAIATMTTDGMQALAALASAGEPYDVVILDARMPGLEGRELLQRIRQGATGAPSDQKVIIYTAAMDSIEREQCARLGVDAVLDKPLSFMALRQTIASVMRGETRAPDTVQPDENSVLWQRDAALAALDNDAELLARLCRVLLDDLRKHAKQIEEAVQNDDMAIFRRLAHACKNSAGTLRFDHLQYCARMAEEYGMEHAQALQDALHDAMHILEKEVC